MSDMYLTTSAINQMIESYKATLTQRQVAPVKAQKTKYSDLSSAWSGLTTQLSSLQTIANTLKVQSSSSIFNSRQVSLSSSDFLTATASNNATPSSYSLRVNQLAKSDLLVSETKSSDSASGITAGEHKIQINSGDYTSSTTITVDGTETYDELMDAISSGINNDYAIVQSNSKTATDTLTTSGSFVIDLNGTQTTINYDYSSGYTYSDIVEDLVSSINSEVDGVLAEKVVDGGTVSLKVTVEDKNDYISIAQSSDTSNLLSNLGINVTKEKSAAALAVGSVFTPTDGNSKFSLAAKESGYENRLIVSDSSGSALNTLGITSAILSDRTVKVTDDISAGYMYLANSSTNNELNSKITFNGINIQRSSNTIDDLVTNVSFTLKAVMEATDTTVNVNVENGTNTIKTNIEDFINKFNSSYTYIKSRYYSDDMGRGIFAGNSTAYTIMKKFQDVALNKVQGISEGRLSYLSEIGISFNPSTGLSLSDSSKFETAVINKINEVADIFNSENGIATQLYSFVESYTGADGSISNMINSLDNNVTYLNDRISRIEKNIDKSAANLRAQYEQMQQQLAILYSNSSFYSSLSGY